jgi:hypothetical protein
MGGLYDLIWLNFGEIVVAPGGNGMDNYSRIKRYKQSGRSAAW